jgi:hypothetical protein
MSNSECCGAPCCGDERFSDVNLPKGIPDILYAKIHNPGGTLDNEIVTLHFGIVPQTANNGWYCTILTEIGIECTGGVWSCYGPGISGSGQLRYACDCFAMTFAYGPEGVIRTWIEVKAVKDAFGT